MKKNLASYTNSNYSLGVANATDGLELSWMSYGLNKGDEVIISSHTMLATASAIKLAGGTPVPVDIRDDGLINPDAIESAINHRTVGISPTQLNGRTCEMDRIMDTAKKHNLVVIEDAAQALGSMYKGKMAGTFGYSSCISFYPAKVLGCLGDGGAVLINSDETYDHIYKLRDHGRDKNGNVSIWGRNSRLDNMQAAILDFRLSSYADIVARRREIAKLYDERLSNIVELILPPKPSDGDNFDIFQNYELQATNRNQLQDYLSDNGIGTLIQWGGEAIHHFKQLGFNQELTKTDQFFKRCIMIPINTFITNDDVNHVCNTIEKFYTSKR